MAKRIRCPFCHEYIDEADFGPHAERHRKLKADGQHTDYVTLPPEDRDAGSLAGVPKVYVHRACGARTGMPEEIIRSYLQNPYLYSADRTFCTGCGRHVPLRECTWVETGEDLQHYTDALRAAKPECKPAGWDARGLPRPQTPQAPQECRPAGWETRGSPQPRPRPHEARARPQAARPRRRRRPEPQGCFGSILLIVAAVLCVVGAMWR